MRSEYASDMANEHLDILDAIHRKDSATARLAAQIYMDRARTRVTKTNTSNSQREGPLLAEPAAAKRGPPLQTRVHSRFTWPVAGEHESQRRRAVSREKRRW